MTWFAVGAAAVSATAAVYSGVQGNNAAKAQAAESRRAGAAATSEAAMDEQLRFIEASDIEKQAKAEADNIKRQAMLMRSSIVVAQSGSGVMIGEGSAQAAVDQP